MTSRLRTKSAPRRPRKLKPPFDAAAALAMVLNIRSRPPANERVKRVEPVGSLVARWILPLDLAPTGNVYSERGKRALGGIKDRCRKEMLRQIGGVRPDTPLPGRPMVIVTRFSSSEPDVTAAHSKVPVDALCIDSPKRPEKMPEHIWAQIRPKLPRKKLGYLVDDAPKFADVRECWEPVAPGKGCVVIELWTGEKT